MTVKRVDFFAGVESQSEALYVSVAEHGAHPTSPKSA
jgi:hypothetical protein